jgi:hypothetical protein
MFIAVDCANADIEKKVKMLSTLIIIVYLSSLFVDL